MYDNGGRLQIDGGISGTPDGEYFALQQPWPPNCFPGGPCVIEWRRWDDLLPARTVTIPHAVCPMTSLESSPDGRWLVFDNDDHLFLLDWHTGELISRHFSSGYATSGLAFDPTSTFVAGLTFADGGGGLDIWRLDPVERFVARPAREDWPSRKLVPQDEVCGNMALTLIHEKLDRTGIAWAERDLAITECLTACSPDGRIVVFSLNSSYSQCGMELVAYEVRSGRRLWCTRNEEERCGAGVFTSDGRFLVFPMQGSELFLYRVEDGMLTQRLSSGLDEPVQALASSAGCLLSR